MFRRLREKTRQNTRLLTGGGFKGTSNDRVEQTYKDAQKFAHNLETCLKEVRKLQTATEGLMAASQTVVAGPLPHVFEADPDTNKVVPVPDERITPDQGGAPIPKPLQSVSKAAVDELQHQLYQPVDMWLSRFKNMKTDIQRVEKLRLEYDAERRVYTRLETKKVKQLKASDAVDPKLQQDITIRDTKLGGARQSFKEKEDAVHKQLVQLIAEAKYLRHHISASVLPA